jgi:WD40 repeat protein
MREQLRLSAQQWEDQDRPNGLLWRGEAFAKLERWARRTPPGVLNELECSFVAANRRHARRGAWIRGLVISLAATSVLSVLAVLVYRATLQSRTEVMQSHMRAELAELSLTQADVEQGRQALLHDESADAQLHLAEAYRRGDHSPGVTFMRERAEQPRRAELARFASVAGRMWSATFSPDGRQIVTTDDKAAQLWHAQSSRLLRTLSHGDTVYQAVYSADGTRLITAGGDGTVRIWDASDGSLVHKLQHERHDGKRPRYGIVAASHDGRLVAAIDTVGEVVHVWDAGTGTPITELHNNAAELPALAFSADGRWLATGGGNDVRVFDTSTWTRALTIAGPHVRRLSFDPSGPHLVTGTASGDVAIWAIPSGTRMLHLREMGEPSAGVGGAPAGGLVVAASRDGTEQIWDARSGALRGQSNYLHGKILSVEFDRSSKLVLASGSTGKVVVADAALGMPVAMLEGPQNGVRVAHFDPSSRRVVGASLDGTARVWDATSPYRRWSSPPISDDCGFVTSLEPDRRFIAIGCKNHATLIWDTAHDQLLAELPSVTLGDGDTSAFQAAPVYPAVSTAGDRAAIARGNAVMIYALPGGQLVRTITHVAPVSAVAFAGTGHDLISGATDGSLLLIREGHEPVALPASPDGIDATAFLTDGRVVVADAGDRLRIYAPEGNTILAELAMPTRAGWLRASPDGRRLITIPHATGSSIGMAAPPMLWDLEHYGRIAQLDGHIGRVFSARFVAGSKILTAGGDGTARLWDGGTGWLLQTYRGSSHTLTDAMLTPDGTMVVAGGDDGLLRFWEAETGQQLWALPVHKTQVVGIHFEGDDLVTRGFLGDISRWNVPSPSRAGTPER